MKPEHAIVLEAMPVALRVARTLARLWRVRSPQEIEDCEQTACAALLEACPTYDESRGPLSVFAWKRVAGAVTKLLKREGAIRRGGLDAALDAAAEIRDAGDLYADDEGDPLAQLKGHCRWLTFTRFMGDTRERLAACPDDALARAQALGALRMALGTLSEQEVRVLELRYWEDLSWAKVAEAMGVHEKYAQRLDERLRERLRRELRTRDVHEAPPCEAP